MRQVRVPMLPAEEAFQYYCPICGIELSVSNYETPGGDYFCPYCSTEERASRVLSTEKGPPDAWASWRSIASPIDSKR
jgi:DNA-directed RNA polymerase subunit RPC12/RpoP